MSEAFSGEQHQVSERQDQRDLKNLSFAELQSLSREVAELARTTFRETKATAATENTNEVRDGFVNVDGNGVWIVPATESGKYPGRYKISYASPEIAKFNPYIATEFNADSRLGSREELMGALKKMVLDCGFRIIE